MTVKSWKPNSISSKSPAAFVTVDSFLVDEPEVQTRETKLENGWAPCKFPDFSTEKDRSSNGKPDEEQISQSGSSSWMPPEIEDAFVVNRDDSHHFAGAKGSNQYFKTISAKAESILAQANDRVAEIIARAEKQANEIIQQAESQAMHLTHQAYQDGLAAANAEISDLLNTARAIAEEVDAWRDDTLAKSETMILRLVIEIAQSLFGDGLPLDPDTLGNAFSRALSQAKTLGDLRIYVSPEDTVALTPHWAQQQTTFSGQKIELIPSEIIKRGGCFIEGQYGNVDARIETQLQMAKDTLLETLSVPVGNSV